MRPTTMKRGFIMRLTQLNLVVVLLLLCLIASDEAEASRKFLTGLIIGTLLARNGVQQAAPYPVPQPSYSHSAPQHQQPLFIIIPSGGKKSHKPMIYPAYGGAEAVHEPISYGAHRRSTAANKIVQQLNGRKLRAKHRSNMMSKQVASRLLGAGPINSYLISHNGLRDIGSGLAAAATASREQWTRPGAGFASIGRSSDSVARSAERYGAAYHLNSDGTPISKRKQATVDASNDANNGLGSDVDNAYGWVESVNNGSGSELGGGSSSSSSSSSGSSNGTQLLTAGGKLAGKLPTDKDHHGDGALLEVVQTR